jgi:hypothetical protein
MEKRRSARWAALLAALFISGVALPAAARLNGLTTSGCQACHTGGRLPTVSVTLDPPNPEPGARAMVKVRIAAVNGGGAGFYLHAFNKGTFQVLPGQGARLATDTDVVHANPKAAVDGMVTFDVGWVAPAVRGTVDLEVFAVAANGNNAISGDGAEKGRFTTTVGCMGIEAFLDTDGDGFGSDLLPKTRICELQAGYSLKGGDCNDYISKAYPGAIESCNDYDDDCDGVVNEGLDTVTVYRDADGDGYGAKEGTDSRVGCGGSGYSVSRDDCDDKDRMVSPAAKETCNTKDDNCNGRIDEGARFTCGIGWCRAAAPTCDSRMCLPGSPRKEECNAFDDDCDGVLDNGATCVGGKVCYMGRCLGADDAKAQAEAEMMTAGPAPDGGAAAGTGGASGAPPVDAGAGAGGSTGVSKSDPGGSPLSCAMSAGGGRTSSSSSPSTTASPAPWIVSWPLLALAGRALRRQRRRRP